MNTLHTSTVRRSMRILVRSVGFAVVFGLATTLGGTAHAEEHFDVAVASGQVTVTAKGDFHINKDFPWKLVMGEVKLDKTKFALSEKSATLSGAPKGTGIIKGAVCSKDTCLKVEREVTIP